MDGVLDLVKPFLENSEPEKQPDQNHHRYQANAAHAHLRPATHLLKYSVFSSGFDSDLENNKTPDGCVNLYKDQRKRKDFFFFLDLDWFQMQCSDVMGIYFVGLKGKQ
ncbi:hypothetical protein Dsin_023575 [Dipteronia sinensis]|uniref:Uncharacterized protein n=1 Tax=Dipteronia sinensis TaxID=43782 RepID=A0AAE0A3L9_9ROSI|nr:hypothetical protein Dsin_023575 [Dipteronia sinensis]